MQAHLESHISTSLQSIMFYRYRSICNNIFFLHNKYMQIQHLLQHLFYKPYVCLINPAVVDSQRLNSSHMWDDTNDLAIIKRLSVRMDAII